MNITDIIQWETVNGEPFVAGGITVTPQAQALSVRLPFGGFVWNRPVAVLIQDEQGSRRMPIRDVTRIVQVSVFAAAFMLTVTSWLAGRARAA
jgi:hypothetical protein